MADQEVDRRQIPSGIHQRKYHTKVRGTTKLDGPSATFSRYVDFALGFGRVWGRLRRGAQPNVGAVSAWTDIAWFGALVHDPRWGRFFSQTKSPATGRANRK
jgi:hypothetical protein